MVQAELKETQPLYVTCPVCDQTVQCYGNGNQPQASSHVNKQLEDCTGSHRYPRADELRTRR